MLEPDSKYEFENYQNTQKIDLFDIPLEPFEKSNGGYYYPEDTFNTRALDYIYDALIYPPMQ